VIESPFQDASGQWSVKTYPLVQPGTIRRGECGLFSTETGAGTFLFPETDDASVQIVGPENNPQKPETTLLFERSMHMCLAFRVPRTANAAFVLHFAGSRTALVPPAGASSP
jgi:hypothetical protein